MAWNVPTSMATPTRDGIEALFADTNPVAPITYGALKDILLTLFTPAPAPKKTEPPAAD